MYFDTSRTAHRKPGNIIASDLQFARLAKSNFLPSHSISFPLAVSPPTSLLVSMERKHLREIRPGRAARRKILRRVTRNKNAVNSHFLPRCVIVRRCRRDSWPFENPDLRIYFDA
jgi:hypothetical protein